MASNRFFMLTIVVIFLPAMATATDYIVGDDSRWTINFDYQAWAKDKVFYVGDKLVFQYPQGYHNVFKVNGTAFKNCDIPPPNEALTSGNDTIVLKTPGRKWYICGVSNHCAAYGQKLNITVQYSYGWAPALAPIPKPWTPSTPPVPATPTGPWAPTPAPWASTTPSVPATPTEPWAPTPAPWASSTPSVPATPTEPWAPTPAPSVPATPTEPWAPTPAPSVPATPTEPLAPTPAPWASTTPSVPATPTEPWAPTPAPWASTTPSVPATPTEPWAPNLAPWAPAPSLPSTPAPIAPWPPVPSPYPWI